MKYANLGM